MEKKEQIMREKQKKQNYEMPEIEAVEVSSKITIMTGSEWEG